MEYIIKKKDILQIQKSNQILMENKNRKKILVMEKNSLICNLN